MASAFSPSPECANFIANTNGCSRSGVGWLRTVSERSSPAIGAEIGSWDYRREIESLGLATAGLSQRARQVASRSPWPVQAAAVAALQAFAHARLGHLKQPLERWGLVVGGHNLTLRQSHAARQRFETEPKHVLPSYAILGADTDHVGTLSEILGIRGEGLTVGGSSASGNVAIIAGCRMVASGAVDGCLVVGALAELSPVELQAVFNLGAMADAASPDLPANACRPFDRAPAGFVYGQAAACLVLESTDSARARDIESIGRVRGFAANLDANRRSDPSVGGEARAIAEALHLAGVDANDIDYVNAHGTGTRSATASSSRRYAGSSARRMRSPGSMPPRP